LLAMAAENKKELTKHISPMFSISTSTASIANIGSLSRLDVLFLSNKTFGAMTVARFLISIFEPDSSSTWWNDPTHFRKQNRISKQSRFGFGSKQQVR